ncbi:MAG: TetR/AcrR family transcriptional regulator [Flavobacteriales bacterium]
MISKAKRTRQHILEKVAPVFNKQGYFGTSMSQITTAIGLSKGAVYGNFESKEELAIEAFNYNLRKVIFPLADRINAVDGAILKLKTITGFYREYYAHTLPFGGCPIINVGIDSNNQNPKLTERVQYIIRRLTDQMAEIIEIGKQQGEIKQDVSSLSTARRMYSMIEGALFSSVLMHDEAHLLEMMDYIDMMIDNELVT